ncbi:MAG: amino acid permease [Bacteroidales bacterium]|nr:amino acid permease [Bacteroidales bacterium]
MNNNNRKFGTAPVFFTAISTILGAILFLRFGYAVGTLGFWGVIVIIFVGHLVTIPTALALSEIATNKRVEGGGEYFIISRSFGLNIGATIGVALYLSQAISVAFYVIAFTESFEFLFNYFKEAHNIILPRQLISIPIMLLLSYLILKKGANMGVKALYVVVAILALSLILFFTGTTEHASQSGFNLVNAEFRNMDQFFVVFAIIFPAFTGMTAGVGLSGDLKNPGKSIPFGTTVATISGMIIYFFVSYKLALSANPDELVNNQFVMSKIAKGGVFIIPLGLAASTISSALGSVMVAPRTLQALAVDRSFPLIWINRWLSKGRKDDNEPVNASIITCIIALVFVALGNVNAVARIISMFFMVTYGSLCLISFLNHFGSSPSYRPSFKSKWIISLIGFVASVWIMFKIDMAYTLFAFGLMIIVYIYINSYHHTRKGLASIFANAIFQINRNLQIYLQKKRTVKSDIEWRPSVICISKDSFERDHAFRLLNWISYKYGFGTYLHRIDGYYSRITVEQSKIELEKLIKNLGDKSYVYIDTIISPSYTSAVAQSIQIPGIAGMENNMLIFEYDKEKPEELNDIIDNFNLVNSGSFDVCILASSRKSILFKNGIHIWIKTIDEDNANLMILLSFIILGHPDWKKGNIKIFDICKESEIKEVRHRMSDLLESGRLPITTQNIEIITQEENVSPKAIINKYSSDAGLTIIGFREESLKHEGIKLFDGYDGLGNVLFVNSCNKKIIE